MHVLQGKTNGTRTKTTCYNARQLAPALFNIARESKKLPSKLLKAILGPLVAADLRTSLLTRTQTIAMDMAQGNIPELLTQFPAYIEALKSFGHDASAHIVDSDTLSQNMLSWAREGHKMQQRSVEKDKRTEFDEDTTKDLISSVIDSSYSYLIGFDISPGPSRDLWLSDDIRPVVDMDFAHIFQTGERSVKCFNFILLQLVAQVVS